MPEYSNEPSTWDKLRDEVNDAFRRFLPARKQRRDVEREEEFWAPTAGAEGRALSIDLEDKDDEIVVTAEVPGVDKDEIKVNLTGNRLVISGEKKSECERTESGYYYSECRYGSFARSVTLPAEVEADRVEAKYRNGVLKVRLPKTEQARSRRITIHPE